MPYKLLLADDSLTIQKVVELVLAPENFEIMAFNDGEQALQALESFKPDIILADIDMPKLNGYQLCEKIKNNVATAMIPVILLAGAFEPFDEEYAKSVFADDFIIKPFESQELISKVKALLVGFEQAKKTMGSPENQRLSPPQKVEDFLGTPSGVSAGAEQSSEVNLSGEATPEDKEEPKWDEEVPVAEEKFEDVMADEEYEARVALSSEGLTEVKGFEEELAEALKKEEPAVQEGLKETAVMPSVEEIPEILKKTVDEKISDMINNDILPYISSTIKDSVKQTVSAAAPNIIENVTRELMKDLIESLRGEIDAAIKRVVPEVAETLIKKEIEKITSELK